MAKRGVTIVCRYPLIMRGAYLSKVMFSLILILVTFLATDVRAMQVSPEVRDEVIPAAVQIVVLVIDSNDTPIPFASGSGTVVSPEGLILTNWHVVDMASHQSNLNEFVASARSDGTDLQVELLDEAVMIAISNGEGLPEPRYAAVIVESDPQLDLAVLRVVGDLTDHDDSSPIRMPYLPLGDSDAVKIGDPLDVFGYPGNSGGILTYTSGVVSGIVREQNRRSWLVTDAVMSGGSSGGTAVNRQGELIGIPTQGAALDCRPGDINRDGRIDEGDVGCIPVGGSVGDVRPVNLAKELLRRAGLGSVSGSTSTQSLPPVRDDETSAPAPPLEPGGIGDLPPIRLPTVLPLDHANCFGIVDGGPLTFSQLLDRFAGYPDAESRLLGWGWQASAYRQFGCDGPPDGEAGWIDISVHGFSSAESAQEAADYFAATRMDGTSLRLADGPGVGDYSVALGGRASNGTEFTIYATQGPWLVRVTGVSPSGIPFMNVRAVTLDALEAQDTGGVPRSPSVPDESSSAPGLPSEAYLPSSPNVNYADCFRTHTSGGYAAREVDEAFAATGIGASATTTYGWRDGAYVVFMCDDPPFGRARQLDVVIHQFRDSSAADQVLPYVDGFFTAGDHQSRACDAAGPLVICVTGYADTGSPLSDVHFVLNQVVASAR